MTRLRMTVRRFFRDDAGNASIEFCILFPAFLFVMLASIESGLMMTRNVVLERSVDIAVRDLRLGATEPDFDALKARICENALIMKDCDKRLQMELRPVSTTTFNIPATNPNCRDVKSNIEPIKDTTWIGGGNNELMIVRVCALFDPILAPSAIALKMPTDGNGNFALVAKTAFVNEPTR